MSRWSNLKSGVTARLPGGLQQHPLGDTGFTVPPPIVGNREPSPTRTGIVRNVITIVVPGAPIGKPRMTRRDRWAKRPAVMRYREWADLVRAVAGKLPPAEKVESLSMLAKFEPPKSMSKKKRAALIGQLHRVKPDVDNIAKCIDAIYPDGDQAIAEIHAKKVWDWEASVTITITLVPE